MLGDILSIICLVAAHDGILVWTAMKGNFWGIKRNGFISRHVKRADNYADAILWMRIDIQTLFPTVEEDVPWHNNGRKDDSMLHTTIRKIRATEQAAFLYFSEWSKSILYYSAKLWVLTWTVIYKTSSVQPCKLLDIVSLFYI